MLPTTFRSFRTLALAAIASAAVAATSLPAQTAQQPLAVTRITQPVDNTRLVPLKGNVHPLAQARFDKGIAPISQTTGRLMLVLKPSSRQKQALRQYVDSLQDPGSPNYHKWITPSEYGALYGATDSDLQTIQAWLQSQGFAVEKVSPARNVIQFSGTVGQVQSAFHTAIHRYQVNGAMHFANTTDPEIPAALASVVAGVAPLNDFRPKPQSTFGGTARYDAAAKKIKPNLTLFDNQNNPSIYVDPADAATIYNTPNAQLNRNYSGTTYDGTGVTIGIAGDSRFTMQDVQNYRATFLGETSATANLPNVIIDGNDPGINGDQGEALLDVEIAGGLAPKATINFYTADSSDMQSGLFLAIMRAINDNAVDILNVSFGGCEAAEGDSFNQFIYQLWQQAAAQGITVTVSTGDNGSAGCDDSNSETQAQFGLAVNGIASTPYNIAVGGTDYDVLLSSASAFDQYVDTSTSGSAPYYGTAKSYIPEAPWNNSTTNNTTISNNQPYKDSKGNTNITAASGGNSNCVTTSGNSCTGGWAKPAFQQSLTPNDQVRDLPDVSFLAANGLYGALWVVCADNVANGDSSSTYTDCTTNGQITNSTTFSGYGGTSASSPAFAGMLALVKQKTGKRLGQANNVIYQLASSMYSTVFHDVTVGNISVPCQSGKPDCGSNGFLTGFDTSSGYDLASGLGSVDVTQLVNNWSSVALTSTSTSLQINGSTAAVTAKHGQSLTFNFAVNPSAATGDVSIIDSADDTNLTSANGMHGNNAQGFLTLSGGTASATYGGLPGGTYTVYGYYGGDTTHAASQSNGVTVNISTEGSSTALSVSGYDASKGTPLSGTSFPYGAYVVANAQPYGTAEGQSNSQGLATGSVTFTGLGSSALTTKVNSTGVASIVSPSNALQTALTPGNYSVQASYAGDASYTSSTSGTVTFSVVKGATATGVDPATTTVASNGSVQLTVTVTTDSIGAYPSKAFSVTSGGANVNYTVTSFQQGTISDGTVAAQAVITVPASSLTAALTDAPVRPSRKNFLTAAGGGAVLACVLFFGIPARRRSWRVMLGLLVVLVTMAGIGCGSGGGDHSGGGGNTHTLTVTFTGDTNYNASSGTSTVTTN